MARRAAAGRTRFAYERPWIAPYQEILFWPARIVVVEASTKSGKTVGCMLWLLEQAVLSGGPGRAFWWVAPIYGTAKIAFRRYKNWLPKGAFVANETELTIRLANGSTLWFKGSDRPDSLYGEDVYAAVIDEATRCREEAWHAVRSTLTFTRGPVRIIGNVKGRKNWAFKLARRAEAGERGMAHALITALDAVRAGVLAADEIAEARRDLPGAVFDELYMGIPTEDGSNPFGVQHVQACAVAELSTAWPLSWGWDLGRRHDWTVGVGLDAQQTVSRFERFRLDWATVVNRIAGAVGAVRTLVDETGVGDVILPQLRARINTSEEYPTLDGYWFTQRSKQQLMEALAVEIQAHRVHYPAGGLIQSELEQFEYHHTRTGVVYAAPEGQPDDCVTALALALRARGASHPLDGVMIQGATSGWQPPV